MIPSNFAMVYAKMSRGVSTLKLKDVIPPCYRLGQVVYTHTCAQRDTRIELGYPHNIDQTMKLDTNQKKWMSPVFVVVVVEDLLEESKLSFKVLKK